MSTFTHSHLYKNILFEHLKYFHLTKISIRTQSLNQYNHLRLTIAVGWIRDSVHNKVRTAMLLSCHSRS